MSTIDLHWHPDFDDVIVLTSANLWSSEDMVEAVRKGYEMVDVLEADTYSIIDLKASERPPSGFITHYMELGKWVHPNTSLTVVMVPSAFMEQLGRIFSRAIFSIKFAHDMDEALSIIEQHRSERAAKATE